MYNNLQSGDVKVNPANPNYTKYLEVYRSKCNRDRIFEVVCMECFRPIDDPELGHKLVAWLLIADEWKSPINQTTVNVLFFAMCNNIQKNRNVVITNMQQAYTLYKESDNDFRKLQSVENDNEHPRFESLDAKFALFLDGFFAKFKIPVRFVSVKKGLGKPRTLRMLDMKVQPEFVYTDGSTSQVSWNLFRGFFDGNKFPPGRIGVYDGEKIASAFNYELRVMVDVMNYLGFHVDKWLQLQDILEKNSYRVIEGENKVELLGQKISLPKDSEQYFDSHNVLQPHKDYFVISGPNGVQLYTM